MANRHIDRSSEIDRLLLRDSESGSDNADSNLYSDHDIESEFDLDEVCEAEQHEEESDRKGRSLLQPYMSLRAQQGNLPREIRALAAKFLFLQKKILNQENETGALCAKTAKPNIFVSSVKRGCACLTRSCCAGIALSRSKR
ncbi:hypothetical protein J6590_071450 [Homalodisca vitripennis]|nr:hypothetical protein J6590_071450 [Homalodisca vitripennis]